MWNKSAGFTLIEVVVMMTVVSIGVLGTLGVANLTLRASDANQDRTAATNLSREGIELVRSIRDSNWAAVAQGQGGATVKWDCYVAPSKAGADPPSCDGYFGDATANYVVFPRVGDGSPALVPDVSSDTRSTAYLICQAGDVPVYTPAGATLPCPDGTAPFYRRITISPGRLDKTGQPISVRVQSSVNWPSRKSGDIVIETYLTDWRKL
jgi:type II secretory pathway pseudopilin PulG